MNKDSERYKLNNQFGEKFDYMNIDEERKQKFALNWVMNNETTIYTPWFTFIDPYPDTEPFIPSYYYGIN